MIPVKVRSSYTPSVIKIFIIEYIVLLGLGDGIGEGDLGFGRIQFFKYRGSRFGITGEGTPKKR